MANLTPIDTFSNVYQLETSDFVQGGAGGTANQQAQEAANRTEWLKNRRFPIGAVAYFGGGTAPSNFLQCNGAVLLRANYSELFDVIKMNFCGLIFVAGEGYNGTFYFDFFKLANTIPDIVSGSLVTLANVNGNKPSALVADSVSAYFAYVIPALFGGPGITLHTNEADALTGANPIDFGTYTEDVSSCAIQLSDRFDIPSIPFIGATYGSVYPYIAVK